MIDVKQAVTAARAEAKALLDTDDLLLEEVESTDSEFLITLSTPRRRSVTSKFRLQGPGDLEYKRFRVRKSDGEVLGMAIRQIGV